MSNIRRLLSFSRKEAKYLLKLGIVPFDNLSYENLERIVYFLEEAAMNNNEYDVLMLEELAIKFTYFLSQLEEYKDETSFSGYILFEKELFVEALTKVHHL